MKHLKFWIPGVLWMGLIYYLSSLPDPLPVVEPFFWKETLGVAGHFGEYAVLTLLLYLGFAGKDSFKEHTTRGYLWVSLSASMVYALADEIHQIYVPGRRFQMLDLGADFMGSISAGIASFIYLNNRIP